MPEWAELGDAAVPRVCGQSEGRGACAVTGGLATAARPRAFAAGMIFKKPRKVFDLFNEQLNH